MKNLIIFINAISIYHIDGEKISFNFIMFLKKINQPEFNQYIRTMEVPFDQKR